MKTDIVVKSSDRRAWPYNSDVFIRAILTVGTATDKDLDNFVAKGDQGEAYAQLKGMFSAHQITIPNSDWWVKNHLQALVDQRDKARKGCKNSWFVCKTNQEKA